jgi:hypothetical protein
MFPTSDTSYPNNRQTSLPVYDEDQWIGSANVVRRARETDSAEHSPPSFYLLIRDFVNKIWAN